MNRLRIGEAARPQSPVMRLLMVVVLAATVSVILGDVEAPAAGVNPGTRVVNLDDVKTPAAALSLEDVKSRAPAKEPNANPFNFQSTFINPEHSPVSLVDAQSQAPAKESDARLANQDDVNTRERVRKPKTSPANYRSPFMKPEHSSITTDDVRSQGPAFEPNARPTNPEDVKAPRHVTKQGTISANIEDVKSEAPGKRRRTRPSNRQAYFIKGRTAYLAKVKSQTLPNIPIPSSRDDFKPHSSTKRTETSPADLRNSKFQAHIESSGINSHKLDEVNYETPAFTPVKMLTVDSVTGLEETMRPTYQRQVRENISPSRVKRAAPPPRTKSMVYSLQQPKLQPTTGTMRLQPTSSSPRRMYYY